MPTYAVFTNYTEKGIKAIKESPARLDAFREFAKKMGAEIKQAYLVMGRYDGLIIAEAPDDKTIAKLLLIAGMEGNVTTETFKLYTEAEMREVIAGIPS